MEEWDLKSPPTQKGTVFQQRNVLLKHKHLYKYRNFIILLIGTGGVHFVGSGSIFSNAHELPLVKDIRNLTLQILCKPQISNRI
jgi:hypothetical protein